MATVAIIDMIGEALDAVDVATPRRVGAPAPTGPAGAEYLARIRARLARDREEYVADIEECQRRLGVTVLADEREPS